jgi:hypothetical protein
VTMVQPINETIEKLIKEIRVAIDDYNDTIHAIIGFVNLYLIDDTYRQRPGVKGFQGRHLTPLSREQESVESKVDYYVSPDLGVVIEDKKGILGEVQKNFPKDDTERGTKVFAQLKGYDQALTGWPVESKKVGSHEIVLLVHLTTSAYAKDFYQDKLPRTGVVFEHPFSIVEFGRFEQMQEFFLFRAVLGEPTEIGGEKKLRYGVSVPMRVFLREYAKTKLYDAQPPVPYLAELIWTHIVTPIASENPNFEHLRKNQKIEVTLAIDDVVDELNEDFSFHFWHGQYPELQPRIPHKEWVREACQFLVESAEAKWVEGSQDMKLVIFYHQRYKDILTQFILSHATLEGRKLEAPMFPGFESKGS